MKARLAVLFACALAAHGQPAQIILLRHAEEPSNPAAVHLSARGGERAKALVSLLGTNSAITLDAPIAALFATRVTKHGHGQRTGETLSPLAKELGLPVQTPYGSELYAQLARDLLSEVAYRGRTVVICWTHHDIAELAAALGVHPKPQRWKDKTFDRIWVIAPVTQATLQDLPQNLLKGDSKR